MRNYTIKSRQDNLKVVNQEYFECYEYWYDEHWDVYLNKLLEKDELYIVDYEYLPIEIEREILNLPFQNYYTRYHSHPWYRNVNYQIKMGCLIDSTSYYSVAQKRDLLLEALFSPSLPAEDPNFSAFCRNWKQLL